MNTQTVQTTQPALFKVPIVWRCPLCGGDQDLMLEGFNRIAPCDCKKPITGALDVLFKISQKHPTVDWKDLRLHLASGCEGCAP